jgi:hypothetical protein
MKALEGLAMPHKDMLQQAFFSMKLSAIYSLMYYIVSNIIPYKGLHRYYFAMDHFIADINHQSMCFWPGLRTFIFYLHMVRSNAAGFF